MDSYNVLFLCNGDPARAIMSEAILNAKARGRYSAYSAGGNTSGDVHKEAIAQIEAAGITIDGLRSRHQDEFMSPGSSPMNFVYLLSDSDSNEISPEWPGDSAEIAHWNIPDPAAAFGTPEDVTRAYHEAFTLLDRRINLLLALPASTMDELVTQQHAGRIEYPTAA